MEPYLWWVIAGIALVIAELASGTFYLLVLAVAAFAGAAAAWAQQSFWIAAVLSAAVATGGVIAVSRYRVSHTDSGGGSLDVGQNVVFESWVSEADRLARVRYRNAQWDARVLDEKTNAGPLEAGRVLHIRSVDGNTLHVSVMSA
jgi:membrane protein implicated in regulation of membrane protease activity